MTNNTSLRTGGSFQVWMLSNLAVGAGFSAFVSLLIPPYVTQATGSAADAGIVMAVISLAAVLGPVFGSFADKYRAHRIVLNLGILAMTIAFAAYALSSDSGAVLALDAILMGAGIAAVSAVGPVFIVGAGLEEKLQASRLTIYSLIAPVGQVIGGVVMTAAATAGLDYAVRFWIAAGAMLLVLIITWFSSAKPAERVLEVMDASAKQSNAEGAEKASVSFRKVLFSVFGVYLLVLSLASVTSNGINNQISNILPQVYGIDEATTSGLISLAGLLNIGVFFLAGWWMGRSGLMPILSTGLILRVVGPLGMAILGTVANAPILLVAASMQLLYQAVPFMRLAQPVGAVRFSIIPAGAANGWVIGMVAIGSFVGSILGGVLAETVGFNAINWMAAIASGIALILTIFVILPADRRKKIEAQGVTDTQDSS